MSEQIPGLGQVEEPPEPGQSPMVHAEEPSRWRAALSEILGGSAAISVLAIVVGLLVGAVFIALFDEDVHSAAAYFFARPGDTFEAILQPYVLLFRGSVWYPGPDLLSSLAPLTSSLYNATPLIATGLGIALAFRVGLFNIGAQGQVILGAIFAGIVTFDLPLPAGLQLPVALVASLVGGAVWGGVVGALRAWTGAHEVITTIMLNYVALNLLIYLLKTPVLQLSGQVSPKSPPVPDAAALPLLIPRPDYKLDLGFVIVLVVTAIVAWLFNRSSLGFRFRAVGENPSAARTAGIDVKRVYFLAMVLSGLLAGLGGFLLLFSQANHTQGLSPSFDASRVGFDAITVALLGRSRPWGVFLAGLLLGALHAGSFDMQGLVPNELVGVIQSVIVLLIAAPPLVRAMFHLPQPVAARPRRTSLRKAVVSK